MIEFFGFGAGVVCADDRLFCYRDVLFATYSKTYNLFEGIVGLF